MVQSKSFLCKADTGGGSVRWSVSPFAYYGTSDRFVEAGITLTDCGRTVSLEFDTNSLKESRDRLAKIDTLITELASFREALYYECNKAYKRRYC